MVGDWLATLTYPVAGDRAERPLLSCWVALLLAAIVPVVPLIPVAGYLLRVLDAAENDEEAPAFLAEPKALLQRGLGVTALSVVYLAVPVAGLVVTVSGALGRDVAPGGFGTVVFYAGSTAVLWIALFAAYLLPVALSTYGRTGRLRDGFDTSALRSVGAHGAYFVRWVAGAATFAVAAGVGTASLAVPNLGPVIAAFFLAYGLILTAYVWGRGIALARRR